MNTGIDELNKLKGINTAPQQINKAVNDSDQTIDKVKSIVEGVAGILNKVSQFKGQIPQKQAEAPKVQENVPQHAPVDMQQNKRAMIKIDDTKLMALLKQFSTQIPAPFLEMPLKDIIQQGEGNEQMINSFLSPLIKEVTSVEYVN